MIATLATYIFDLRRKIFGSVSFEDPRPLASENPYTYYLPPRAHLDTVDRGDIVKLIFCSKPAGKLYDAERMWVIVNKRDGDTLKGVLDNDPFDMPQIKPGDEITFLSHHIIDIDWDDDDLKDRGLERTRNKQIWERCFVDDAILDGSVMVEFIYREAPDMTEEEDKYKDSGWRIRGDVLNMTEKQYENGTGSYIALGKVLNKDDSWIGLIDSPAGSAFLKNWDTGEFEPASFTMGKPLD